MELIKSFILREGISHIEDLSNEEFISTVENIQDKVVTEKLDGANLWFGLDDTGFFTSREGKSPKKARFYDISDYPKIANFNGFRGAHLALEKMEPVIRKHLKEGDTVEVEVLFGRQPNTVTYGVSGKNFIVILRGVGGTDEARVAALVNALNDKSTSVSSAVISSDDGEKLTSVDESMVWEFASVAPIKTQKLKTAEVDKLLNDMKIFLKAKNSDVGEFSNGALSTLSMSTIPKEKRPAVKDAKDKVIAAILSKFKIPIKDLMLNGFVRKIKPFLQDKDNLHPAEDIGVEGVVIRDPVTGSQTKIVDKDVFTAINAFNSAVRSQISGLVKTTDQEAAFESRGGVFGQAKIRIAEIMGNRDLAMSSGVKRVISKFKKGTPQETAQALADTLNVSSVGSVKAKLVAILNSSISDINNILGSFVKDSGQYTLTLKTGKEIGISPTVMKKTLTAFAETKKEIKEIISAIAKARTTAEIVMALYGKTILSIHDGDETMKEHVDLSIIKSLVREEGDGGGGGDAPAASATTTTAGNIAPYPFKMFKNKIVSRRKRNWTRPKKFKNPYAMGVPESTKSILKSVNEDLNAFNNMQNASDVTDKASSFGDVQFNQLRNNVKLGGEVTQMDVSKYLNKAHEVNDEVETITFGLEQSDGSIVKVYVDATQAEAFEKHLSTLLGKYDDVEDAIEDAAGKFDIIDVEWPNTDHDTSLDTPDEMGQADDAEAFGDYLASYNDPEDVIIDTDVNDTEDLESDEDLESEVPDIEDPVELRKLLKSLDEAQQVFEADQIAVLTNPALASIAQLLTDIGFDINQPRSFIMQAKRLQSSQKGSKLKSSLFRNRLALVQQTLDKVLGMQQQVKEAEEKWVVADLQSMGIQLTCGGMSIQLVGDGAKKLLSNLQEEKTFAVKAKDSKMFKFTKIDTGWEVTDGKNIQHISQQDLNLIINQLAD